MSERNFCIFTCLVTAHFLPGRLQAAKRLWLAFSALVDADPPFGIAHDLKLFEKYRLDPSTVLTGLREKSCLGFLGFARDDKPMA
jgi:hypothetical protein